MNEEQIKKLIADAIAENGKSQQEQIQAVIKQAVAESTKTITAVTGQLDQLAAKVNDLQSRKPTDGAKDGQSGGDDPDGVTAALKALKEQVESLAGERDAERKRSASVDLVTKYLQSERPGIYAKEEIRDRLVARIAAGEPKDHDAVAAAMKNIEQEYASAGVDVKSLCADPPSEGEESAGSSGGSYDKDAHIESVKNAPKDGF